MRARARSCSNQDVHAEILQRGVQDFLHVGKQPVNLVDEEDLARANIGENASEVQLLLQDRPGGLLESHAQFAGNDGSECRLAKAGRPIEQNVIHGLAAPFGGLDGDRKVFLEIGLASEIGQPGGTQSGFELALAFQRRGRCDSGFAHVF